MGHYSSELPGPGPCMCGDCIRARQKKRDAADPCPICNPEKSGPIRNPDDIERIAALEKKIDILKFKLDALTMQMEAHGIEPVVS